MSNAPGKNPPSVGRIVHYVVRHDSLDGGDKSDYDADELRGGEHLAAIIVGVEIANPACPDHRANLVVWRNVPHEGPYTFSVAECFYSEAHEPGTWHWPERVS